MPVVAAVLGVADDGFSNVSVLLLLLLLWGLYEDNAEGVTAFVVRGSLLLLFGRRGGAGAGAGGEEEG